MAKLSLRTYIKEVETLIERGNTDEAISHCRHILKSFPKFLDAYRMLGKAYLESRRYNEAADVFKRVLMSVPEDFVSHVGLSIINDEQKKLDDTIWHMERAFETQPSNAAVQSELQRLYGKRDGMEPHKIRLTRGALAHMYVQGELYPQAIGEIRSVLLDDPGRTDMQTLLALAYFRNGQKVEATETCSQLLGRFPYCLNANRILVEILPGTGMADSIPTYRGRVIELDPYASHSPGSIFQSDEAPDNAVTLERFDYKGQPVEPQTDWKDSIGLAAGTAAAAASQPDWLRESAPPPASPRQAAPTPTSFASEPAPAPAEEDLPDFMRQAGWGASTGAFDESAPVFGEEAPAPGGELERADLPDWIKGMAPPAEALAAAEPTAPAGGDDMSWLNNLGGESAPSAESAPATSDAPDWLSSMGEPSQPPAAQATTPDWLSDLGAPSHQVAAPAAETPDWLSSLGEPEQPAAAPASAAPDWLSDLGEPPRAAAESPDWLSSLGQPQESTAAPATEETPDWLSNLGAPESAPAAQPASDQPDWLSDFGEAAVPVIEEQPAEAASIESSSWMSEPESPKVEPMRDSSSEPSKPEAQPAASGALGPSIGNLGASSAEQDAAMLWLESLAAKQGAKAEELITNPNERLEKPPEWVEQAKTITETPPAYVEPTPPPAPIEPVAQEPAPVSAEPTWPAEDTGLFDSSADISATDQTSAWLRSLEAEEEKKAEEPVWSGEIDGTPPATGPLAEPAAEADLPSWLRDMEQPQESARKPGMDELPSWLMDEENKELLPEPTRPTDWAPEIPAVKPEPKPEPTPEAPKPVAPPAPKATKPAAAPAPVPTRIEPPAPPAPKVTAKQAPVAPVPQKVSQPAPEPVTIRAEEPVPAPKPAKPAPRKKTELSAADRATLKRSSMLPPTIDPVLAQARDALEHAKIPDALQAYGALIRKGKSLEEVTFDLKEALYRFPVEVSIWQTLGDAYMRANRLQDALDAYTKAEELLR